MFYALRTTSDSLNGIKSLCFHEMLPEKLVTNRVLIKSSRKTSTVQNGKLTCQLLCVETQESKRNTRMNSNNCILLNYYKRKSNEYKDDVYGLHALSTQFVLLI